MQGQKLAQIKIDKNMASGQTQKSVYALSYDYFDSPIEIRGS